MLHRIKDWSLRGYISLVNEDELVKQVSSSNAIPEKYRQRNRNNIELAALMMSMVDRGLMESAIMKRCRKEGWSSEQLASLVDSFRAVQGVTRLLPTGSFSPRFSPMGLRSLHWISMTISSWKM